MFSNIFEISISNNILYNKIEVLIYNPSILHSNKDNIHNK